MIKTKASLAFFLTGSAIALAGCTKHEIEVKPIEIKPIYIQLDIRIQQQVNQSLAFVEQERGIQPTTVPANVAP